MSRTIIEGHGLAKTYSHLKRSVEVLKGIDLTISTSESVAIVGPSGSGKSTLLYLLGLLEPLTDGSLKFEGQDVDEMSDRDKSRTRLSKVGFIFQFHHLLPELTALENVILPGLMLGESMNVCSIRASELLTEVGLEERIEHKPGELSGGEQQRVAFARALMNSPDLVLADEPTGNLDSGASRMLQDLLWRCVRDQETALLIVTHNYRLAEGAGRILQLTEGNLKPI